MKALVNLDTKKDPAFDQRVLKFLKGETVTNPSLNGWHDYIAPNGPGIDVNLFNNKRTDETTIYVFTPCILGIAKASENCMKYPNRYEKNSEVHKAIGSIFRVRNPTYMLFPYVLPISEAEANKLGEDSRGAVLFQYDPNSDGKGKKAWRLFMEATFKYKEV